MKQTFLSPAARNRPRLGSSLLAAMGCVLFLALVLPAQAQSPAVPSPGPGSDSTPPAIAITAPLDGAELASVSSVAGWVTEDWALNGVTFTFAEVDPENGGHRYWNGASWQGTPFALAATITGTNFVKAASVTLPPLNSGVAYEIEATATDGQFNTASAMVTIHAPIETLVWDPGLTHLGTQVRHQPNNNGGPYLFRIVTEATAVGGWRTALNVTSGEADLYLSLGPSPFTSFQYQSGRTGSDGFVLTDTEFNEGQEWFYGIRTTPGSTWNLVSGEAYVLDLGTLPGPAASGDTNVVIGAEGWRFFRTTPPAETLAWRLWLHGATNEIFVNDTAVALVNYGEVYPQFDLRQASAMLVVPDYLQADTTYFVGVPGTPGEAIQFHSKQQPITDRPFNSTNNGIVVSGYPYTTYRVAVPIEQIAWEVRATPASGDPNVSIRREKAPNEFNNDAYSEVPGTVEDGVTLVPPTLSDAIFYITVYGSTNRTFSLFNGEPTITDRGYVATTTNNLPARVGWRFYRVFDIPSQLGTLGWELLLSNQVENTEIALRRNAVPGRWQSRVNGIESGGGHVDYFDATGWLQRPGHQADIWYIGVYQPLTNLGTFTLTTRALTPTLVAFNNGSSATAGLPPSKWRYLRIDVPADAMGWDMRLAPFTANPQFAVRRDLLPEGLGGGGLAGYPSDWPSGAQVGASQDWTGRSLNANGTDNSGKLLAVTRNNPLQPGTYYVGIRNEDGSTPADFTFVSRGIGTNYAIGVSNLSFSGAGSSVVNSLGLPAREAAYYCAVIPSNQPSWVVRLTPSAGEALLLVQAHVLPNVASGGGNGVFNYAGKKLQKLDQEHYLLLPPAGQSFLDPGTNYLAVVGEGVSPSPSQIGPGLTTYTLSSLGVAPVLNIGNVPPVGGGPLTYAASVEGGQVKLFQFRITNTFPSIEIRLLNRTGNPSMAVLFGTNPPYAHVPPPPFGDNYGADDGEFTGRLQLIGDEVLTIANPAIGTYTFTIKGEDDLFGAYPDASCDVTIRAVTPTLLAFDGGSTNVTGHAPGTWRYFQVNVPPGASGWDLRLQNATGSETRLHVRSDLLPEFSAPSVWIHGYDWPSGQQFSASSDWTGLNNFDGTTAYGRVLAVTRQHPLTNGTYFVGVYNSSDSTPEDYSLVSRGIGAGLSIPLRTLNYTGAGSAFTNAALPPREVDYFCLVIPANSPSWVVRLTPETGDAFLVVQRDVIPNVHSGGDYYNSYGKTLRKLGREHYLLLPEEGQATLPAMTNYLIVVSEGDSPSGGLLGAAPVRYRIESLGPLPVTSLGAVPAPGAGGLSAAVALEVGQIKAYRFVVPASPPPSIEVRLEDRTGEPHLRVRHGSELPYPHPYPWYLYGADGGWGSDSLTDASLLTIANPLPGTNTIMVKAEDFGLGLDATATLTVRAVGPAPLAFNNGTTNVTGQAPRTWKYFQIEVPPDADGWDLRVTSVAGGDPQIRVRRDELPSDSAPGIVIWGEDWPIGYQLNAGGDWTGLSDPGAVSVNGRILVVTRRNPLTNGTYFVGVYNASDAVAADFTITSRGIGASYAIPVNLLAYSGGVASEAALPAREAAYYRVVVPANAPSWKVRLNTLLGSEAMLLAQKDRIPNVSAGYPADNARYSGKRLQKAGNEHYVLLPDEGQTVIEGGTYYLVAVSEGVGPSAGVIGSGSSAFDLESQGPLAVTALGTVPAPGSALTHATSLEGAEVKAFSFNVPNNVQWMELRLTDRLGNPALATRAGAELPYPNVPVPFNTFAADGGWFSGRVESYSLVTYVRPPAGTHALTVKAEYSGPDYPAASTTIEILQRTPATLAFSNGVVAGTLADNQRTFYEVTVPPNVLGWKLDLVASNGTPTVRARKDLLPSDAEPGMGFGGPSVVIATPFLEPGTWYVEVKGGGTTEFELRSNPVLLQRPAWNMPAASAPNTTPGLTNTPVYADTGYTTNGTALPGDGGTDLGNGDFHYYAINVPNGNVGLLRAELYAISGNPDLYLRYGGLPTFSHLLYGGSGPSLVDYSLTGTGSEYGNWTPIDGKTESQLAPGTWYLAVNAAGGSNVRYRMKLTLGAITNLAPGVLLTDQVIAAGDWRYYRVQMPTNAPVDWNVTFSQQQGDVVMYVRDTVPPGDPLIWIYYREWTIDAKNDGPYANFDTPGTDTLSVPPVRPGHIYYLGFRAVSDASFSVSYTFGAARIAATNRVNFYGGVTNFTLPAFGKAEFYVPVPADATSWRHYATNAAGVEISIEQGTVPDLSRSPDYRSYGEVHNLLVQYLYGWPWVSNQNYYVLITNTTVSSQPVTFRMDGRNAATDDSDGDGLPDGWEILHFGNLSQAGWMDSDGDGIDNATELAEGTSPASAASLRPRLTVLVVGSGSVTVEPFLPNYPAGQPVTLTAVPDSSQTFDRWTRGGADTNVNPLVFAITSNTVVTAYFAVAGTPLTILPPMVLGGVFSFTLTGPSGGTLVIQATDNFGSWDTVHTETPFTGSYTFVDTEVASHPTRSFKAWVE